MRRSCLLIAAIACLVLATASQVDANPPYRRLPPPAPYVPAPSYSVGIRIAPNIYVFPQINTTPSYYYRTYPYSTYPYTTYPYSAYAYAYPSSGGSYYGGWYYPATPYGYPYYGSSWYRPW